ncbi:hypothetical protein LXL04_020479 [Taraxacum kok-saghyz]
MNCHQEEVPISNFKFHDAPLISDCCRPQPAFSRFGDFDAGPWHSAQGYSKRCPKELLDELSNKLIEAISIREQQLVVGTVSQDLETEREDDTATVRVMSPSSESSNGISESDLINCNNDDQELKDKTAKLEANNLKEYLTSFEDFLDLIDQQLNKIETELMTAVKFSSLVLESKKSSENVKVQ